jgi:gliding-associated putative ABC transporter substrate-binding component GldG
MTLKPLLTREARFRNELTMFLTLCGILILVNFISTRSFIRWDFTRAHAYSLAKVSKQYMRDLNDPMTVKAFFTKNLPAPYNSNARYLRDLLEDYRTYSRGKFNFQFVDPAEDPSLQKEATTLGVYQIQLTAVQRDKFEQKNGYMGLAVIYQDRKEVIPLIQDTNGLEYQLTSAIKKLLQKETKVIGVTQGYGEPGLTENLENFRQMLAKNYEIIPVDLSVGGIPERVSTLLVAGPTKLLPDDKLYALDQFLRSGRNVAMLAPMLKADPRTTMQAQPVFSGLSRLLNAWGVSVQPNLIYDMQCQRISVAQRGPGFIMQNIVPYPPFPLVTDINRENPINQNLESYTLPFISSLALNEGVLKNNSLKGEVLAKSSPRAWEQKNFFMLSPQFIQPPQPNELHTFDLIAAVSGKFPSAFSPDKLPQASRKGDTVPGFLPEAKPARLLVVGCADLLSNDFMNPRNTDQISQFALNAMDWVAQDPVLIEIRNKGLAPVPLAGVGDGQRRLVKYFNMIGLPLLVALGGLLMWRRFQVRRLSIAALVHCRAVPKKDKLREQ